MALIVLSGVLAVFLWQAKHPTSETPPRIDSSIESTVKNMGELVVMKAVLKEIVTAELNTENLSIPKKAAMIFKFDINFKYDLREKDFAIHLEENAVRILMPQVKCDFNIKDVIIYDKQPGEKWLQSYPITVSEENQLIQNARKTAEQQVSAFVQEYRAQYQASAESIMKLLADGFGYQGVTVEFKEDNGVIQEKPLPE